MNLSTLVAVWAGKYDVESALECVADGAPSACDLLATRGVRVMISRDAPHLPDVRADLVLARGEVSAPRDWRGWLMDLGKRASKVLVVVAPDPERETGQRLRNLVDRVRGDRSAGERWGRTSALAPVLWEVGRVREHERVGRLHHAFAIDVTPRTPQARRKLRLASTSG